MPRHTKTATTRKRTQRIPKGEPVDARHVLRNHMRSTLGMMDTWGQQWANTTEAATVRAAIKNYLVRMEQSS